MKNLADSISGFTLVEIIIIVAIIGMTVTMAMPGFVRARENSQEAVCLNNLRMLQSAKQKLAMEMKKQSGDVIQGTELNPYMKVPFEELREPAGYTYLVGEIGVAPLCTFGGAHVLGSL